LQLAPAGRADLRLFALGSEKGERHFAVVERTGEVYEIFAR
jgi:hypothetical protein